MKYIDADLLREKIVCEVEQWKEKTANHYTIEAEARWSEANYILGIFDSLHLDTLSEEPDKSLEEAAENIYKIPFGTRAEDFIAGAEYQARQLLQGSPMPEDTVLFNKGVAEGRRLEREDVMMDSVEGEVYKFGEVVYVKERNNAELTKHLSQFNNGDKVRIIIVKED